MSSIVINPLRSEGHLVCSRAWYTQDSRDVGTPTCVHRNPLISFVYERGWRQGFSWAGFPGVEKEFEMGEEMGSGPCVSSFSQFKKRQP